MDFRCFYFPLFCIHWLMGNCLHTPADGLRSAASVAAVNALIDRNEAFLNG